MIVILKLILFILVVVLIWSALCGAVAFFKDLHKFKSDLEFSGTRKDLIKYLTENKDKKETEIDVSKS